MSNNIIRLYHGTNLESAFNIAVNGIDLSKSEKYLDFGSGFYLTNDPVRAAERAWQKVLMLKQRCKTDTIAYMVELELDIDIIEKLSVKKFADSNDEWKQFVLSNRFTDKIIKQYNITEHNRDFKYDIVEGGIADGSISEIVFAINQGKQNLQDVDIKNLFTKDNKSLGFQLSLHTPKALSCIKSISCDKIKMKNPYIPKKKVRRIL